MHEIVRTWWDRNITQIKQKKIWFTYSSELCGWWISWAKTGSLMQDTTEYHLQCHLCTYGGLSCLVFTGHENVTAHSYGHQSALLKGHKKWYNILGIHILQTQIFQCASNFFLHLVYSVFLYKPAVIHIEAGKWGNIMLLCGLYYLSLYLFVFSWQEIFRRNIAMYVGEALTITNMPPG